MANWIFLIKKRFRSRWKKDAEAVMKVIEEFEGVPFPFNDKVSPEIIKREFDSVRMHLNVLLEDC